MYLFVKQKNKAKTENKQVGEVYFASAAKKTKKTKKKQTQRENITPTRPIGWAAET